MSYLNILEYFEELKKYEDIMEKANRMKGKFTPEGFFKPDNTPENKAIEHELLICLIHLENSPYFKIQRYLEKISQGNSGLFMDPMDKALLDMITKR